MGKSDNRSIETKSVDNGVNSVLNNPISFPQQLPNRMSSSPTVATSRIPAPVLDDVVDQHQQTTPPTMSRFTPDGDTVPSSSILTTTFSSPPQSSVRFTSHYSTRESLSSLLTSSSSGGTSPTTGPSRPRSSQQNSGHASSYTSAVQYKRPISNGSTLFAKRARPSTKLKGEIEKPWVKYPDPAHRWGKVIFWSFVACGLAVGALGEHLFALPYCVVSFRNR
jgi:hypothetical protein